MPSWSKLIQIAAIGVLALSTGFLPEVSGQCTIPEFDALIAQTTHQLNAGNYPARIQKNQQQGKMARVAQLQAEFAHLNDDLARWNRRRARVLAGGPCVLTPGGVPPPVVAAVAPYPYGYYHPGYPGYHPGSRYIPPRVTPSGRVIPGRIREAEIDDAIEADDAEAELDDDSTDQVDDATAETDDATEQVDDATAEVDETPVEENVAEVDGALDADEEELQFKKKKRNEAEIDSAVEAESASVPIEPVSAPLAPEHHENKRHHRGGRHHRNRRHRRSHHPRLGVSVNVHVKA